MSPKNVPFLPVDGNLVIDPLEKDLGNHVGILPMVSQGIFPRDLASTSGSCLRPEKVAIR